MHDPERNFILQQGLEDSGPQDTHRRFKALLFQPRLIGLVVLVGITLQSSAIFLGLWAVLWWSALLPHLNPFDALYNRTLGTRPGAVHLGRRRLRGASPRAWRAPLRWRSASCCNCSGLSRPTFWKDFSARRLSLWSLGDSAWGPTSIIFCAGKRILPAGPCHGHIARASPPVTFLGLKQCVSSGSSRRQTSIPSFRNCRFETAKAAGVSQ